MQPYAGREGSLWPQGERGRKLFDKAKEAAGFDGKKHPWPNNALRHSYASYHLAHFRNAAKLSLEMGHTDQRLIFAHYRELVKPQAAAVYWSIMPQAPANVITMPKGRKSVA